MSTRDTLAAIGRLAEFRTARQLAGDKRRSEKLRGRRRKKTELQTVASGIKKGALVGAGIGSTYYGAGSYKLARLMGASKRQAARYGAAGAVGGAISGGLSGATVGGGIGVLAAARQHDRKFR